MKNKVRKSVSVLLLFGLILSMLPLTALAADDVEVLTSIGHKYTDKVSLSGTQRDVTLTAAYGTETVDLKNDLDLTWDDSVYSDIVASFPNGSEATVGRPSANPPVESSPVEMLVTYYMAGDLTLTPYTTTYHISVVEKAYKGPAFSGSVSKIQLIAASPVTVTFSSGDFEDRYTKNDGKDIGSIQIEGSNRPFGALQFNGADYSFGTLISMSDIGKLTFAATDAGEVSYNVSAYEGSDTATAIDSVLLKITIDKMSVPTVKSSVSKSVYASSQLTFAASDFTSCCGMNDGTLDKIEIKPSNSGFGTWYNGATPFTDATEFTSTTISSLKFTGSTAGTEAFTWRVSNEAGYSDYGTGTITVSFNVTQITYTTYENTKITFDAASFNTVCNTATGKNLSYVKFALPSSNGKLYYNYTSSTSYDSFVGENTSYYRNASPYLDYVSFVPASNYDGKVSITYTGYDTDGASYTGTILITVQNVNIDTVTYTTNVNETVLFKGSDFNAVCYDAGYDTLDYIKITEFPKSSYGTLYYGYSSSSSKGTAVEAATKLYYSTSSTPYLNKVAFVPYSNYTGTVTISYTGYDIKKQSFSGTIKITVVDANVDTVTYLTGKNETFLFKGSDFNAACDDAGYDTLDYIKITEFPKSSYGTLYYGYSSSTSKGTAVEAATKLYYSTSSTPYLNKVAFVPYSNYTGTVTISYTGYDTRGRSFSGTIKITVGNTNVDTVTYSTGKNETVLFKGSDFNNVCDDAGYSTLDYITITQLPKNTYGTLYYGYSSSSSKGTAVKTSTTLNYSTSSTPYLNKVAFVPYSNYTGTVTISYTGYDTRGRSFSGTIKITVVGNDVDTVTYETGKNETVVFNGDNFNSVCDDAGYDTLNYIKITELPSASCGKLYYGYTSSSSKGTAVVAYTNSTSGTKLYYDTDNTPYLDRVAFIPYSNYTGTVTIRYTGYDTDGESFSGTIKITVGNTDVDTVTYETGKNETVIFDGSDFNNVCDDADYETLDYIKITELPSASCGKLYYGYSSSSSKGSEVKTTTKLYYDTDDTPYLDKVAFVPYSNYTGTVTIGYTGYDTDGESYSGTLKISVEGGNVDDVTYETGSSETVVFDGSDFNNVCDDAGYDTLDYIKIAALPSASCGKLYYGYSSSSSKGSEVKTTTKLYYDTDDTPYLDKVAFVPVSGYTGTVTIKYTGYDTDGQSYSGSIKITVASIGDITYTTPSNTKVTFNANDFNNICSAATSKTLSYVKFTLPPSASGKLYYNYTSSTNYTSAVTAGTSYYKNSTPYLANVSFVPASGYAGTVSISYTGYSSGGGSYSGTVKVVVTAASASKYFTDLNSSYSWASEAIDYLYEQGVVKGTGTKSYSPGANITRGDFILMLYRALKLTATTSGNFTDVAKGSYYYDAIAVSKALGIAQGSGGYFYPTTPLTRQDAMALVYRAMQVKKISITAGASSDLASFTDKGSVSSYAATAVATLVKAKVVVGSGGKINPSGNLTRAEMAVILYRVLKL